MIKFENVSKTYDKKRYVLNNLNLTIDDGEFVFVMGPSGAGKTTLTKLLLREETLTSGKLYVDNYRLDKIPARKVPFLRRNMGFVFQDFRLFENKTVYENVAYAMEVLGEPKSYIRKKVPIALEIVGLTDKENVMPRKLSGGEKQRLCVARAIVNNPSVIVADEPTGNLDTALAKDIMDLLVKISTFGKTVIVVTHASDLVRLYEQRIINIRNGELVSDTKYPELATAKPATVEKYDDDMEPINNSEFVSSGDEEHPDMTYTDFDELELNDNTEETNNIQESAEV
ncbi:MAG: ATP-binding cassette domain-containing protein [Clostridia bacterium]|nr:ATP-binding cassette domain-containing protein [Clostridia bacterium]